MADRKEFKVGDRVFAKVRGYPSWPARVKSIITDAAPNSKNTKIEVFFFGTYETAVCRPEEVCDYESNKEKLGKMQKRKFFKEALHEIENEPNTEGPQRIFEPPTDFQKDEDALSEVSVASSKPSRRQSVAKKRESVEAAEEEPRKKAKRADDSPSEGGAEPERVSRSGRKIKPKRFLDEEEPEEERRTSGAEDTPRARTRPAVADEASRKVAAVAPIDPKPRAHPAAPTPTSAPAAATPETRRNEKQPHSMSKGGKGKVGDEFAPPTATVSPMVSGKKQQTPLQQAEARKMKVTFTQQQAQQVLDSDKTPDKVKEQLSKEMALKAKEREESARCKKAEKRRTRLLFLRIEVRLLQIDTIIKANLSLDKAETKPVLQVLDELKNLKLNPIMLKKHPDIVFTIKKLRRYVGNTKQWNHTDAEKEEFSKKAGEIRQKASQIFEYFKFVLLGSKDATDVNAKFLKQINELREKTKNLTPVRLAALAKDPTVATNSEQSDDTDKDQKEERKV